MSETPVLDIEWEVALDDAPETRLPTDEMSLRECRTAIAVWLKQPDGYSEYGRWVKTVALTDPEQLEVVEKIDEILHGVHGHLKVIEPEISEAKEELLDSFMRQLFVGNLANVLETVHSLKRRSHPTKSADLVAEGNRLAEQWFKRNYGAPPKSGRLILYPADIVCYDYVEPKLVKFRKNKPKSRKRKPLDTQVPEIEPKAELEIEAKAALDEPTRQTKDSLIRTVVTTTPNEVVTRRLRKYNYWDTDDGEANISANVAESSLLTFILDGTPIDFDDLAADKALKVVLQELAGTDALKDPDVLQRFKLLQELARLESGRRDRDNLIRVASSMFIQSFSDRPEWQEKGYCNGIGNTPETSDRLLPKSKHKIAEAKSYCVDCKVKEECLQYALGASDHQYGIWGGTDEDQRVEIRRAIKQGASSAEIASLIDEAWKELETIHV